MAGPSGNQYNRKLASWGVRKYFSGSDWASVSSVKRKRSQEGKDSDFAFYGCKVTRQKLDKEIARHVPLSRSWCSSEKAVLPDYITVSTPPVESLRISRMFLLRNLPWYDYGQEIQALGKSLAATYNLFRNALLVSFFNHTQHLSIYRVLLFLSSLVETNKMASLGRTAKKHHLLNP